MNRRHFLVTGGAVLLAGAATPGRAEPAEQAQPSLEQLTGDAFDRAFLTQMIAHHATAVQMARPAAVAALHQETRDLADAIIADQAREIALMRNWLKTW